MAAGAKLPPLADEMKPPRDPAAQQRGIFGKAKRLAVGVLPKDLHLPLDLQQNISME